MASDDPSPSAARRQRLRDADNGSVPKVLLDSHSIDKYYALADRLLGQFDNAVKDLRLDDAYVYGVRFATFSIEALPSHASYKKVGRETALRKKNSRQVERVLRQLEGVTKRMDAEELDHRRREEEEVRLAAERAAEAKEAEKMRQNQAIEEKLHALQMETERKMAGRCSKENVAESKTTSSRPNVVAPTTARSTGLNVASNLELSQSEERRVIAMLRETINKQERRLSSLDESNTVPLLLREAKSKWNEGDKRGAAHFVAKKRRLEREAETVKNSIFTMETQILLLESAAEDREAKRALAAAKAAMESLRVDAGDAVDAESLMDPMSELGQGIADSIILDEDEVLSELGFSLEQEGIADDDHTLLSLPKVPANEVHTERKDSNHKPAAPVMANIF